MKVAILDDWFDTLRTLQRGLVVRQDRGIQQRFL